MNTATTTDRPAAPRPPAIPVEIQAAVRRQVWELCAAHGLRYPHAPRGGKLRIDVDPGIDWLACCYPDHSLTVAPAMAGWLLDYHRDPARYRGIPVAQGPADALLTIVHETIHCCFRSGGSAPSVAATSRAAAALLAGLQAALSHGLVDVVDELIVELAARQVASAETGIRPSEVSRVYGGYEQLIALASEAVRSLRTCSDDEARDRLAAAAVRVAVELDRAPMIDIVDRLLALAVGTRLWRSG